MTCVALLSNPRSTGNRARLPEVRNFCAAHPDIFHYEVEDASEIGKALASIALVKPKVIAINGGDGTVQSTLTELYTGAYFDGPPPPIAVLPNGKTNLIALDLGAHGDPLEALREVVRIARDDLDAHIVQRKLISLSDGNGMKPVLGMFLGGAGLVDAMLYCRQRIYPLGLPNGISHFLAVFAALLTALVRASGRFLPPMARPVQITTDRRDAIGGRFSLVIVTTLEKMLLNSQIGSGDGRGEGMMKMFAIDQNARSLVRGLWASVAGKLGRDQFSGVHFQQGDTVRIDGAGSSVILDGELYQARGNDPIMLSSTAPVPFLRLAT